MYYGITSLCIAGSALIWYVVGSRYSFIIGGFNWAFWIHEIIWWPLGILWIALSFYDARWLRTAFTTLVNISVLGPFGGYWIGLIALFLAVDAANAWGMWQLWALAVPLWIGYTAFSMIMQAGMVPKILNWSENAPINENRRRNNNGGNNNNSDNSDNNSNFLITF